MRHIKVSQFENIPAKDIKPGHVVAEGVVIGVRPDSGVIFFDHVLGTSYGEPDKLVGVICTVSPEVVEMIRETVESEGGE